MQRNYALNLSVNTINAYEFTLKSFERYLKTEKKTEDINSITPEVLRRYFVITRKTMNGETQQGFWRRLNTFFNFLVREEIIKSNPMYKVEKPRRSKRIIETFNSVEVYKMLNAFNPETFIGRRNYTIIALLLSTGLRRSEYLNLHLLDVNLNGGFIRVIGKGDKERIIPISKALSVVLRQYIKSREDFLKGYEDTPYFIISKYRRKLSIEASNSIFRNLRKDLKLTGKRFSAHTWRHTFAKAFLLNGGDVFTLQELLGHADIETTKVYINLTDAEKAQQNAKFNPLDNTKWHYY